MKVGILTISDRGFRGEREDESGHVIKESLSPLNAQIIRYEIVPDDREMVIERLKQWADELGVDLILTTGGTGLSPRDITPEATLAVVDKLAPGFVEAMRVETRQKTPTSLLSRAVSGIRKRTLIINLPGSPKGVRECLEVILPSLPHAVETLGGEAEE